MVDKIFFFGINLTAVNRKEIIDKILEFALIGKSKFITYLNAHCANIAFHDKEYRNILNKSDLVYAGGQGVVWASKFIGSSLPERVNILDFFDKLAQELEKKEVTLYLLGEESRVIRKTREELEKKRLKIVGYHDGFFNEAEEINIIREINLLKPHILMVGMGVPRQEKWIYSHLQELDVGLCWAVGGAFSWLSGYRKRAPSWMIKCGLEWMHRLFQEPKRLWKRYLLGNLIFIYRIIRYKLGK